MQSQESRTAAGRAEMALVGALAGVAFWALVSKLPDILTHPQAYLAVASFVAGFLAVLLGMSGPHKVWRAATPALCLSLVAAALLTWSSMRFETLQAFTDAVHPIVAWIIFLGVGTPFSAALLRDHHSLRDYGHLFDVSWSILVRYSAGWLFVGICWAVLLLSNALLNIAGLTLIGDLLEYRVAPYLVSGLALGFGLSVVHEMRDYLSPFLVLRLLRLLVPVLLIVVVIFIAATFLQDSGALFGTLSRTATLLAVALAMIALVSIALDRGDSEAVGAGWMRMATAALAVLIPVLAGLAIYALWLRIAQYGWTPGRLVAATTAVIVAVYGCFYALSVAMRGAWMERIRQANIRVAVLMMFVVALWQTPLFNAEWLSTRSQVARVVSGAVSPQNAALWEMDREWGAPGRAGLAQLSHLKDAAHADLQAQILRVQAAENNFSVGQHADQELRMQLAKTFVAHLQVPSTSAPVTAAMLSGWSKFRLQHLSTLCEAADAPGCVAVLGAFTPSQPGPVGMMFIPAEFGGYDVYALYHDDDGKTLRRQKLAQKEQGELGREEMQRILSGAYEIGPSSRKSLWVNGKEVFPGN